MQYDSPDPALPRAQPPAAHGRYLSIDVLRAVAILLMIQVHAVDNLSGEIRSQSSTNLYYLSEIFGYMSAPVFTLLSGLSYSLWLQVQKRSGASTDEIVKYSLRRGMLVFVLGFIVNFFVQLPENLFDWDILALIGVAAIILTAVRNWHPGILIAICIVILIVSPPLRDMFHYQTYWSGSDFDYDEGRLGEVMVGLLLAGYFPLLPWLAFPLAGFALGQIFYRSEKATSLPLTLPLLGVLLLALALLGALFQAQVPDWFARYYATGWPRETYLATTVYLLCTAGGILIVMWVLNRTIDLNPRVTGRGPIFAFFRRYSYFALTAYIVHLAVLIWPAYVLAWLHGKTSADFYVGRLVSTETALILSLVLIAVLYLVLIFLDRHRKYSLEYFMRWICT